MAQRAGGGTPVVRDATARYHIYPWTLAHSLVQRPHWIGSLLVGVLVDRRRQDKRQLQQRSLQQCTRS